MRVPIAGVALLLAACHAAPGAAAPTTVLVSVANAGATALGGTNAALSADGRYVAFASYAKLVADDTNDLPDIYVRDMATGATVRASVTDAGLQANQYSESPSISADGRYVAFVSAASNLVVSDRNGRKDIFVRDMVQGVTRRANIAHDGTEGDGDCASPRISANGRCVAYVSDATNLVPNDTNGVEDVFLRDMVDGTRERISVGSPGTQGNGRSSAPGVSADGRFVIFNSSASNLIPNDFNVTTDGFVRDRVAGTTTRVNVGNDGGEASTGGGVDSISADGRYVCFSSSAPHLVVGDNNGKLDVFVRDMTAGTTVRVSVASDGTEGNNGATGGVFSADLRYIAFTSGASNIVPGDTNERGDTFIRDTLLNTTTRVSLAANGSQAEETARAPSLSADGRYVAWHTFSTNLTPGDTNSFEDVYLRGPLFSAPPTLADAALAMRLSAGLTAATPSELARLDIGPSATLADAVSIARQVDGG
jgi:Tol biopolymer transport system component